MTNYHHEKAAAKIWNWQQNQFKVDGPNARQMRLKGTLHSSIAFCASAFFWYFAHTTLATVVFCIGTLVLCSAWFSPTGLFTVIDRGGQKLGLLVSNSIKWLLLPLLYFLFFIPFGKLARRGKKDTMKRFYDENLSTYWISRDEDLQQGNREKQF